MKPYHYFQTCISLIIFHRLFYTRKNSNTRVNKLFPSQFVERTEIAQSVQVIADVPPYTKAKISKLISIKSGMHRSATTKLIIQPGFANFIDEWSHCDLCFTNFGVILEYLESSITTKKAIFRLSSTWSWHVYTIVRDTRSSCGGPLTWKAQIHDGGHRVNFDRNLPSSCFVVLYNSLILMI